MIEVSLENANLRIVNIQTGVHEDLLDPCTF